MVGSIIAVLVLPFFLRWHHAWLIASWNVTAVLFFAPGRPQFWIPLVLISYMISLLQHIINPGFRFLRVPSVTRPLIFLVVVVLITAKLTGGIAIKSLGSESAYGGKRYFMILMAILGYFAITARQIPPHRVLLYVTLFFL